jgi:UDP-N-acetylglucosamine--N-acetylmuramyl-(pentapeptide) pyrophosphoryl-undecaprenol N-acetylglucosamine transferase
MKVVIAGGGTGGHLFPGIAVGEALRARGVTEILFVSAGRGAWREILDRAGFAWRSLPVRGFGRRPGLAHLMFPFRLAASLVLAASLIASFRPNAVVGTGGYVAGPVVLAAWLLRVPVVLLEQNAVPGVTTRIAARFASEIHLTYEGSEAYLAPDARDRSRVTGNPIRGSLLACERTAARARLGLLPDRPVLFVLGGSQGAVALNTALRGALEGGAERSGEAREPADGGWARGIQFLVQTGEKDATDWAALEGRTARLVARPFFHEIGEAYAAADLVLCRAGATTLAEITVLGKAAILVPYPHAAADHQARNAERVERAGAAAVILEKDLSPERLRGEVTALLRDDGRRGAMETASRALGRPGAADQVAEAVQGLARGEGKAWSVSQRS